MSPTMQLAPHTTTYTPTSDAMDRHEYGVTKNRKAASTGGGRAWSEDEVRFTNTAAAHTQLRRGWAGGPKRLVPAANEVVSNIHPRKSISSKPASRRCPTSTSPLT